MARKTFGRAGQPIEVPSGETGESLRIIETDPIDESISESGRVGGGASAGREDRDESFGDFEPVDDVIRTQPIAGTESGGGFTDPTTATGPRRNKDGTLRKPRGSNRTKEDAPSNTRVISLQLEKVLFSLHTMAAATLQEPELCIDEDEAKILADAIEKVANAYNFSAMFSPKTQAGVDLCIALVTVYGHRVMAIARKQRKTVTRNVTPIDKVVQ